MEMQSAPLLTFPTKQNNNYLSLRPGDPNGNTACSHHLTQHATAARAIGCRRIDGGVSKLYVELVGAGEFPHAFAKVSEQRGLLSFCYLAQRIAFVS